MKAISVTLSATMLVSTVCFGADALKPGQPFSDTLPGTELKIEMLPIPAGKAKVMDPAKKGATKEVEFKAFFMCKTEVPWDWFDVFAYKLDMPENKRGGGERGDKEKAGDKESDAYTRPTKPYVAPDLGWGHQNYPAMSFSYKMADNFCKWLAAKTGHKYRLPTEAEWEYACRANAPVPSKSALGDYAWFKANSKETTHPIATKKPNAWGLYDMLGNVSEWCSTADGEGCVRGGSFQEAADKLAPTFRDKDCEEWNSTDPQSPKSIWWRVDAPFIGFRLVCEP